MSILLARHGETDWNVERRIQGNTDIPLNENGIRQAHSLSSYLEREEREKGVPLSFVFTSPLKRAEETAEIVGKRLVVPVEVIPGLEEMDFGVCEGKSWLQAKAEYAKEIEEWEGNKRYHKIPGGESYQDVLERFFSAWSLIKKKLKEQPAFSLQEKDLLLVTHGALLMLLLAMRDGQALADSFVRVKVENARAYSFKEEELDAIFMKL